MVKVEMRDYSNSAHSVVVQVGQPGNEAFSSAARGTGGPLKSLPKPSRTRGNPLA